MNVLPPCHSPRSNIFSMRISELTGHDGGGCEGGGRCIGGAVVVGGGGVCVGGDHNLISVRRLKIVGRGVKCKKT